VASEVAEITGKKMEAVEDIVAAVRCSRIEGNVLPQHDYIGYQSCSGANLAFGGPIGCMYGCIGLGECAQACPFDAITLVNNFPEINISLCVGCGTCVRTCPKNIIELIPLKARVWVPCSTKDSGKTVKQICEVGCISCKICVKTCPADAISVNENLVKVDYQKCNEYGPKCNEICVEKCPRKILRYYDRPEDMTTSQTHAAA
jgi:electron transport complex protein RnfB